MLERRTGIPRATLHDALRGDRLPALDTTFKIVTACGGAEALWRTRWCTVHDTPHSQNGSAPAAVRTGWWKRPGGRMVLGAAAAAVVVGGVVGVLATRAEPDSGQPGCVRWREYTVEKKGSILDRDSHVVGEVAPGERVRVRSLDHGPYRARYEVTVPGSGQTGYVDTANLHYLGTVCL